ncbi:MAG TPA: S53 family peptidase [Solirubrobacteraceae bacterium]|nr:S53 family peptidase [Solirubrobacteraceae bacterium]
MTRRCTGRAARLAMVMLVGLVVGVASASASVRRACSTAPKAGHAECMTLIRTDRRSLTEAGVAARTGVRGGRAATAVAPTGYGYGPSDLQSAYNLASAAAGDGGNATVAVVDAYNDPDAASDLATYRAAWGLPACGTGCFQVLNQNGQAGPLPANSGSSGWATEESLDVDMVSAICPNCKIILVEANSTQLTDLGTAVDAAINAGAQYVSNSYGGSEESDEGSWDASYYNHPGDVITASAGDDNYGVEYPAASPDVVSVGGTTLTQTTSGRGWTETVWSHSGHGTGSGCSAYEPKPSWQTDTGCADRTVADVSADADPDTGVAVYDTYDQGGWLEVGGTSASSPMIASIYALAGGVGTGVEAASTLYAHPQDLYDVTSGSNGSCSPAYLCTGETGYDGPTGLGTPDGLGAFSGGSAPSGPSNTVAPSIGGTPQDGDTLTAKKGTWSPSKNDTYKYQWETCSSSSCTRISGATKPTLVLKPAEVGQSITVEVTATDTMGSTTVAASEVGPVAAPAPPALKKAPKITGTLAPGKTLTGSTGTWSSVDKLTYGYEWEICPGQTTSGCTAAGGATKTLKLTSADAGDYVMLQVTATDQEGQSTPATVFTAQTVS